MELKVGQDAMLKTKTGKLVMVTVVEITDSTVTVEEVGYSFTSKAQFTKPIANVHGIVIDA